MMLQDVLQAIGSSKPGIQKYLALMDKLDDVDVAEDPAFQRAYNGFYRVQRRQPDWYAAYYGFMQQSKAAIPSFPQALDHLYQATGRYEPSFASKLVATLDPHKPVWDKYVLQNIGCPAPAYYSRTKVQDAKACYEWMDTWYQSFLISEKGAEWIGLFDEQVPDHRRMTDLKKVDFILWQMRGKKVGSVSPF
jgi:hypothetical protein